MGVANHTVLIAVSAVFLLPVVLIVLTALMTDRQALTPALWPRPFRWSNFSDVFREIPLLRYTWNTFRIAALATIGVIVSCIPVAYALSRLRWLRVIARESSFRFRQEGVDFDAIRRVLGAGYALTEELLFAEGKVATLHFGDYKIPTIRDIPQLRKIVVETPVGRGPYNSMSIGETALIPTAAASQASRLTARPSRRSP